MRGSKLVQVQQQLAEVITQKNQMEEIMSTCVYFYFILIRSPLFLSKAYKFRYKVDTENEYRGTITSLEQANEKIKGKLAKYKSALKKRTAQYTQVLQQSKESGNSISQIEESHKQELSEQRTRLKGKYFSSRVYWRFYRNTVAGSFKSLRQCCDRISNRLSIVSQDHKYLRS
jgi:hypothetical protein